MGSREDQPVDPIEHMPDTVEQDFAEQSGNRRRGEVSTFTCPECGGTLWQVDDAGLVRFRCHVGHAYDGEALLAGQAEALEAALWTAVRTFREKSVLSRQLATARREKGDEEAAARFEDQAGVAEQSAALIVKHVLGGEALYRPPGGGPTTSG